MTPPVDPPDSPPPDRAGAGTRLAGAIPRLLLPLLLIGGGLAGYSWLAQKPEPPPPRKHKPKTVEARVRPLHREDYQIVVRSQGNVRAHSQVNLTAQVTGRVAVIHPEFEEGALFKQSQVLLELDPQDFELAVTAAEAQVAQAEVALAQEKLRSDQARLDWEDLGYDEEPNEFVLRLPQLQLAEKNLERAEVQLETAKRSLERSKVRAPFDGRVLTRKVGIGQSISGATPLGVIYTTSFSEVPLPIPTRFLVDLSLPEDDSDPPLAIRLRDALAENGADREWDARILRTKGALDTGTLELIAIARIDDPFALASEEAPLRVGQPVVAEIPGRVLEDVMVIPREAVSGLNRIRLVDPEDLTLGSATVTPLWADEENLVVREPAIEDGMLLVLTRLVYAPDGGKVVIIEDEVAAAAGEDAEGPANAEVAEGTGKQ